MYRCRPPKDEDVVKKGRRASAIARLYINSKMREYYNNLDTRNKAARHSILRTATVGADNALAEGVDPNTVAVVDPFATGAWEWSDLHGWWWNAEAPAAQAESAEMDGEEGGCLFG